MSSGALQGANVNSFPFTLDFGFFYIENCPCRSVMSRYQSWSPELAQEQPDTSGASYGNALELGSDRGMSVPAHMSFFTYYFPI